MMYEIIEKAKVMEDNVYSKLLKASMKNFSEIMSLKNNLIENSSIDEYMTTLHKLEKRLYYGYVIRKADRATVDGLFEMSEYLLKQIKTKRA